MHNLPIWILFDGIVTKYTYGSLRSKLASIMQAHPPMSTRPIRISTSDPAIAGITFTGYTIESIYQALHSVLGQEPADQADYFKDDPIIVTEL